jgi:transcriptional regulator with XRE-family HTH domain
MLGYINPVTETTNGWPTYLESITRGDSGARIALLAGIPESTISRWRSGTYMPKPTHVVAIARAYGVNPIEALVGAGLIEEGDLDVADVAPRRLQLREFTDLELAQEMVRRVADGSSAIIAEPLDGDHPAMRNLDK